MKHLLTITISVILLSGCSQKSGNDLSFGKIDSIYSPTLKEYRKVWVYVPHEGANGADSRGRFPVIYLLDGDAHFFSVAGMIQQLSEVNGNNVVPDMVIVAILNTDRTRDLTPTRITSSPYMSGDAVKTSGGSENFSTFIAKELMPYIELHYPVTSYRTLIGHSFGGLFVINTLIKHPELFNSYIAIDPSMWWDNQKILAEAKTALHDDKFAGKSLFLAVAHTIPQSMDTTQGKLDTAGKTLHFRSNMLLSSYLRDNTANGLDWAWKYYDNDSHGSVPLIAEYDALHFLFDFYKLPQSDYDLVTTDLLRSHYKQVSSQLGYPLSAPEGLVNQFGYVWLQRKNFDKAYSFFELNIENYPDHANVYDSMGDYFIAKGDKAKAIEYLSKAIACKDVTPETREKLERLKKGN